MNTFRSKEIARCATTLLAAVLACTGPRLAHADLQLNAVGAAQPLHGEAQVQLDCASSTLKIKPCTVISSAFRDWINSRASCFVGAYQAATGAKDVPQSALLSCRSGIVANRRVRKGGRWSLHRYRRACDGGHVTVNGQTFNYNAAVRAARKGSSEDTQLRFYLSFLDCWGPPGPGAAPDGTLVYDANLGVRDWREDPNGHGGHYHLSVPCLSCIFADMAYE